jgi:hypothetical protein
MKDLNDQVKVHEANNILAQEKQKKLQGDLTSVLKTPEGRRIFSAIFYELRLMRDVSDQNGNAQNQNIGKRDAALWIFNLIKNYAGFDYIKKMWDEDIEQQKLDEKRLAELVDKKNKEI